MLPYILLGAAGVVAAGAAFLGPWQRHRLRQSLADMAPDNRLPAVREHLARATWPSFIGAELFFLLVLSAALVRAGGLEPSSLLQLLVGFSVFSAVMFFVLRVSELRYTYQLVAGELGLASYKEFQDQVRAAG